MRKRCAVSDSSSRSSRQRAALGFRSIDSRCNRVSARFGDRVTHQAVRRVQLLGHRGLLFLGQMIQRIRRLSTRQRRIADAPVYFFTAVLSALPPSSTYKRGSLKSNPRLAKSPNNSPTTVVFGGAFPDTQDHFAPVLTDSHRGHHLLAGEQGGANQQYAHFQIVRSPLQHLLQLRPTGLDEIFTDGTLLQP